MLEFAIVAPLLFSILFGIIEFGNIYNNKISVRQGARDGVRQAVTGRIGTNSTCTIKGSGPVTGTANDIAATRRLVCLTKHRVGLGDNARVAIDVNDPVGSDRGSIAVCVAYPSNAITKFFPQINAGLLGTEVQMRTEQTVVEVGGLGILQDYREPLTDVSASATWNFCQAEDT